MKKRLRKKNILVNSPSADGGQISRSGSRSSDYFHDYLKLRVPTSLHRIPIQQKPFKLGNIKSPYVGHIGSQSFVTQHQMQHDRTD